MAVSLSTPYPTTISPFPSPTFSATTSIEPIVETQETEELSEHEPDDSDDQPAEATQSEHEHTNEAVQEEPQATTETVRSRVQQYSKNSEHDRKNDSPEMSAEFPWTWARNIMLEKPVLKKSARI